MKKILPISTPIIKCTPHLAHVFSVMGAQTEYHIPWVYNYFAQIYGSEDPHNILRVYYAIPDIYSRLPGLQKNLIDRPIALSPWDSTLDFIRCCIDNGYYIYGYFDVGQIAAYKGEGYRPHDPMLYGYDDEKEEIYFADNYQHGKYALGVATYQEIIKATNNIPLDKPLSSVEWLRGFTLIKYTDRHEAFIFDKDLFITLLTDYIEERVTYYRWMLPGFVWERGKNKVWGIGVYASMRKNLDYVQSAKTDLDRRPYYMQMEHKQILEKAFTYLYGEEWKTKYPKEWMLLEKDIHMTTIALNLCLKHNLTSDEKTLNKIREYLIALEDNDRQLFPCLIRMLQVP